MIRRAAPWAALGVCTAFAVTATVLGVANLATPTPAAMSFGSKAIEIPFPMLMLAFPAAGALIVDRRSGNRVGWALLLVGAAAGPLFVLQQYGLYASVTAPGSLPGGGLVMWLATWTWAIPGLTLPLLLLLFPNGRLPSRRWRVVVVIAIVGSLTQAAADALRSPLNPDLIVESPIALRPPVELLAILYALGTAAWSASCLAAAASLVIRYRRGRSDERQQLKWFMYASVIAAAALAGTSFGYGDPRFGGLAGAVPALSVLLIPPAIGVAIFRYRLYDIDVVIERTLVYGSLSAVIAATYVGFVVLFQSLLRPLTGGSEVAVAGSTLATLALVQPARARIQHAVDRRFYRHRYDAARTLDAFTSRLRDEVDLDAVRGDVLGVIDDTLRPAHASLWLPRARNDFRTGAG